MFDVEIARKILTRSLKPKHDEIELHMKKIEKKIKLAAKMKQDQTTYEVIGELMSIKQASAIAITVALKYKEKGFKVKIRNNELLFSWKNIS